MAVYRIPETNSKFAAENSDGWKMKTLGLWGPERFSGAKCQLKGVYVKLPFPPLKIWTMGVNNPLIRPTTFWGKRGIGGWVP